MSFPLPPKRRLLVVADGRRSRLFWLQRAPTRIAPARDVDLVTADRPNAHVLSDEPVTVHERHGRHRHGVGPTTPPHRMDEIDLARRTAEEVRTLVAREGVDEIYVVAAPRALGDLRSAFDKQVRDRITAAFDKDLSKYQARDLEEAVDRLLSAGRAGS